MKFVAQAPAGLLVSTAHTKLRQLVALRIEPLGLSSQQFWVMLLLEEGAVGSVQEVGRRIGIDKAAASRLVDKLAARGWVRSARVQTDRRRHGIELTARGRREAARFNRLAVRINREVERGFGPEHRRVLGGLLRQMIDNLDAALLR